ncbi:unnamed protein product, partial [Iphiclides podalirius]
MDAKSNKSLEGSDCDEKKYEMVPPEGGWGYLICVGLSVIFIAGTAHQPVFGFIYNDFLDELGAGTGAVTVVYGVFQVTVALAGFSANIALKKLSLRQLIITNGFLQGLGMGLLIPVSYTSFNSYFTKKKVLYLSLCKASIGLITMMYPLFIKFTITEYGFRVIPPTPAVDNDEDKFDFPKAKNGASKNTGAKSAENLFVATKEKPKNGTELLFVPKLDDSRRLSIPVVLIPEDGKTDSKFNSNDNVYLENLYKAASVSSLGNFGNIAAEPMPIIKNKEGKWQTVAEFLDLTLLKDLVYDNIIIGMSLTFFSDLTFFTLEPLFLDKNNLTRSEIANIIATGGATDMSARLLLGVSGQFFRMNSRHMFYVGALLTAIFRVAFVQFTTYIPLLITTGVLGALRSLLHIAQPIVMAEHVPIERYPPAYGLYMLLAGGISLTIGPMIGFIRDYTGNYVLAFSMLTMCNVFCVVPWTIEALLKYFKHKKSPRSNEV